MKLTLELKYVVLEDETEHQLHSFGKITETFEVDNQGETNLEIYAERWREMLLKLFAGYNVYFLLVEEE